MPPYIFQRGETISLALDAVTGDPLSVTAINAVMKAVPPGRTSVPDSAPVAATFSIIPRAAQADIPPGWTLTIDALTSATLQSGAYLADARLQVAGGVIVTEPVAIRIKPSVTP
ncbi:hypothetical protein DXH95_01110 [Sphingorhabdus pulchriflava]|uniref:Uncharacterized protein n=1 Tax=Sphingorhabdus pulchriflava TaxID=2292257 RepID=A0A371BEN8_9SPHN|nr:hypothetical protein [Sphingorhabdus pulchriflava]RDV06076.1 hypothetical protein DXH95_01110 [Sphingorhabdus pulchriflava]